MWRIKLVCIRGIMLIANIIKKKRKFKVSNSPRYVTNARTAPCQKCTTYLLGGSKMREVVSRGSFLSRRKHLALDDAASYSRERCIWSKRAPNKNDVAQRRRNNVGAQTAVCFVKFSRGDEERSGCGYPRARSLREGQWPLVNGRRVNEIGTF